MTMGVYCIQVEQENYYCSYVGLSKNIEARWKQHKRALQQNSHYNRHLQKAWNKYRETKFVFSILEIVDNYNKLFAIEKEYAYAFGYGDLELCFNIIEPGQTGNFTGASKLTEEDARFIITVKNRQINKHLRDFNHKTLANYFNVSNSCISHAMSGHTWKNLEPLDNERYEEIAAQIPPIYSEETERFRQELLDNCLDKDIPQEPSLYYIQLHRILHDE